MQFMLLLLAIRSTICQGKEKKERKKEKENKLRTEFFFLNSTFELLQIHAQVDVYFKYGGIHADIDMMIACMS